MYHRMQARNFIFKASSSHLLLALLKFPIHARSFNYTHELLYLDFVATELDRDMLKENNKRNLLTPFSTEPNLRLNVVGSAGSGTATRHDIPCSSSGTPALCASDSSDFR